MISRTKRRIEKQKNGGNPIKVVLIFIVKVSLDLHYVIISKIDGNEWSYFLLVSFSFE
jgi:hypothetical protein